MLHHFGQHPVVFHPTAYSDIAQRNGSGAFFYHMSAHMSFMSAHRSFMSAHMSFMTPQMLQLRYPVRVQITECVL
jgi:hypothetical protein